MNRKAADKKLAALGFEIDWQNTLKVEGYWSGTMDAIGRGQIDGDCRGEVVDGHTLSDFLHNCVGIAECYAKFGPNAQCTDPECDFHADRALTD